MLGPAAAAEIAAALAKDRCASAASMDRVDAYFVDGQPTYSGEKTKETPFLYRNMLSWEPRTFRVALRSGYGAPVSPGCTMDSFKP